MFNVNTARKQAIIACKRNGTAVTLRWTEWPNGQPDPDPTTGSSVPTDMAPSVQNEATTKCFLHFVSPTQAAVRTFAEIQAGDCLAEFLIPLVRIMDPGDTPYIADEVVMKFTVTDTNRNLDSELIPATFIEIPINSLEDIEVEIEGDRWVQKDISKVLAGTWDAVFAGVRLASTVLLRKVT